MLIANVMDLTQTGGERHVVLAQLRQHVQWLDVLRVVVLDALQARNVANRAQRLTAKLADTLRDGIGHRVDLVGLLIEQQMVVAEMRSAHVPVEVLGFQIQRKYIGEDGIHAAADVFRGLRAQIRGGRQGCRAPALESLALPAALIALGHVFRASLEGCSCGMRQD